MDFISSFAIILLLSFVMSYVCERIGFPNVVGEILIGMVFGPVGLGLLRNTENIMLFSNLGVIILMFMGGLGSDLALLKRYAGTAVIVASMGVLFPVIVMGGVSWFFGLSVMESAFIGVIFSATSVSVSVAVLNSHHMLGTKVGTSILGAAVVDDVIGVLLLSIMSTIATNSDLQLGHLGIIAAEQLGFFLAVVVIIRWAAPALLTLGSKMTVPFSQPIIAVVICMAVSWVSNLVGLSYAVGAFFAGIAVANATQDAPEHVRMAIQPIGEIIFIPFFFVSIGLNVTSVPSKALLLFIVVMTILGILTKIVGCGLGALMAHFNRSDSFIIGTGMVARGEMALITAQLGFADHLISEEYYSTIILVITLVTLLAPIIMNLTVRRFRHPTARADGVAQLPNQRHRIIADHIRHQIGLKNVHSKPEDMLE